MHGEGVAGNARYAVQKSKEGSARAVCWRELGIHCSYTLEASLGGADLVPRSAAAAAAAAAAAGPPPGRHFSPRDLAGIGAALLAALPQLAAMKADEGRIAEHLAALQAAAVTVPGASAMGGFYPADAGSEDDGGGSSSSSSDLDEGTRPPTRTSRAAGRDVLRGAAAAGAGRRLVAGGRPPARSVAARPGPRPDSALPPGRAAARAAESRAVSTLTAPRFPSVRRGPSRGVANPPGVAVAADAAAAAAEGAWERRIREMLASACSDGGGDGGGEFTPRTLGGLRRLVAGGDSPSFSASVPGSPAAATASAASSLGLSGSAARSLPSSPGLAAQVRQHHLR